MSAFKTWGRRTAAAAGAATLLAALNPSVAGALPAQSAVSQPAVAPAAAASASAKAAPKVTLKLAKASVTEGDVLAVKVTLGKAKSAKKVTLERWDKPYEWSPGKWTPVRSAKAQRKVTLRTTVTSRNSARYRVSVTYKKRAKPVVSKAATVKVWRWVSLSAFKPYQESIFLQAHTTAVNGRPATVWGPYGSPAEGWYSRHTPGRNCTAFRGVAALTDASGDGAMGLIEVAADGETLWSSTELVPGQVQPFTVPLAMKPYRLTVTGVNLSEDTTLRTVPVVVDPALFCTGV